MTRNLKRKATKLGWVAALAAAIGLGTAGTALARRGGDGCLGPGAQGGPRWQELKAKYDTNKDGTLDPAERQKMREARRAEALARYDKNRDGKLDDAERQAMHDERTKEIFQQIDTNKDGSISLEELRAHRPEPRPWPNGRRGGPGPRGGGGPGPAR